MRIIAGMSDEGRYTAPALEKGLDILELLSGRREALTLGQIGEALGRSRGEIFRMVAVLERRGFIARGAEDRFAVTNRLFELGMRHPVVRGLLDAARPEMAALAAAIGQSCHLAVVSRGHNVVIDRVEGGGDESFAVALGYRRSLADSTSGRVLLAFQTAPRREAMLAPVRADPPRGYDEPALAEALGRIRARGYELAPSRSIVGITDVGAPVLDAAGAALAALTVPFVNRAEGGNDLPGATEAVVAAARRISERLSESRGAAG